MLYEYYERSDSSQDMRKLSKAERKMYIRELSLAGLVRQKMEEIKISSQLLLNTAAQPSLQRKNNIPYHMFRSLDGLVKSIRQLTSWTMEENLDYRFVINAQAEVKAYNQVLFRDHLQALYQAKQELKVQMGEVERRVQQLEHLGFAPFVDYHACLPMNMDLRLSYNPLMILQRVDHRQLLGIKITNQLVSRKKNNFRGIVGKSQFPTRVEVQVLVCKQIFRYRYLRNSILKFKDWRKQIKQQNTMIEKAVCRIEGQKQMLKEEKSIQSEKQHLTQTDYFIYLKQIQRRIHRKLNSTLWDERKVVKQKGRSKSVNKCCNKC